MCWYKKIQYHNKYIMRSTILLRILWLCGNVFNIVYSLDSILPNCNSALSLTQKKIHLEILTSFIPPPLETKTEIIERIIAHDAVENPYINDFARPFQISSLPLELLGVIPSTTKAKEESKPAVDENTDIVRNPRIRRNEKMRVSIDDEIGRSPATPPPPRPASTPKSNPMNPMNQVQDLLWTLFNYYVAYLVFSILFSDQLPFPPNM